MKSKTEFVEEMGQLMENLGLGRMPGRVLGILLICNPDYMSSTQMVEELSASKGSISTVTRMLLQIGFIKKLRFKGDRKAYFQINAKTWPEIIKNKTKMVVLIKDIASEGLEIMKDEPLENKKRLLMMRDFYQFLAREFPALFERWNKHYQRINK